MALLASGGHQLLRDVADATGGGEAQAQPLLPGQGRLKEDRETKTGSPFYQRTVEYLLTKDVRQLGRNILQNRETAETYHFTKIIDNSGVQFYHRCETNGAYHFTKGPSLVPGERATGEVTAGAGERQLTAAAAAGLVCRHWHCKAQTPAHRKTRLPVQLDFLSETEGMMMSWEGSLNESCIADVMCNVFLNYNLFLFP